MLATTGDWVHIPRRDRHAGWHWLLLLAAAALPASAVHAQEAVQEDGLFISVANPITSSVMTHVRGLTERNLRRGDRHIRKIVYDFNPGNAPSGSTEYGSCRDLAEYLLSLRRQNRATTIA